MATLAPSREQCGREECTGLRPALLDVRSSLSTAPKYINARISNLRSSGRAWTAAFWFCAAIALSGIGVAIGTALDSPMLGFIGAGFAFFPVVSAFTSGQSYDPREWH